MKGDLREAEIVEGLMRGRHPYRKEQTGSSVKLIYMDGGNERRHFFTNAEPFTGRQFQILKAIKETGDAYRGRDARPLFFEFAPNRLPAESGELDGRELDLSGAYLTAAEGLLDERLLRALRAQPKMIRLRLMGAMATRKTVFDFDGKGRAVKQADVFSVGGCKLWRVICATVGELMHHAAVNDPGFIGFWVDNYFAETSGAAAFFRARGYRVKVKLARFEYKHLDHGTQFIVDGRPFVFPRANSYTARRIAQLAATGKKIVDNFEARVDYSRQKLTDSGRTE